MIVKSFGKEYDVKINTARYPVNNNLIIYVTQDTEDVEKVLPFNVLTTNLREKLPEYYAYVDTNNCPWAEEFISTHNLGEHCGKVKISGFCVYPLYKFNKDIIERYMNQ